MAQRATNHYGPKSHWKQLVKTSKMAQGATNHYGRKSHWKQQVKTSKMAQEATAQTGRTQPRDMKTDDRSVNC